jgi:general secretion pathway protein J
MKRRRRPWRRDRRGRSGFTLIETLIATLLMAIILGALATLTAQWLPNWNRGFARLQRTELSGRGLERIVADLAAAQFIPAYGDAKGGPLFDGGELSVTFVRSSLGPNARPGLEIVRIAETADARGLAVVRMRAPFAPVAPDASLDRLAFADPTVLMRTPYRLSFAYAGADRVWRDGWRGQTELPRQVRLTVRDAASSRALAISTVATLHVNAPAESVRLKNTATPATKNAQDSGGGFKP